MTYLAVAMGGALGALCRFSLNSFTHKFMFLPVFWCTFGINIIGCFVMGVLMTMIAEKGLLSAAWRLFLCVGFLGGFTTFSSFGYEVITLFIDGKGLIAISYATISVLAGFLAAGLGVFITRLF